MLTTFYRYPHPFIPEKWLYVGQTKYPELRDKQHRREKTAFGRKFRKLFPDTVLPFPSQWVVLDIANQEDANRIETVAIFHYHTWWGEGGMNKALPGHQDYQKAGCIGGYLVPMEDRVRGGRIGIRTLSPEQRKLGSRNGGITQGRKNVENVGFLSRAGKVGGRVGNREGKKLSGLAAVKRGDGMHSPEIRKRNGKTQGKINADNGHLNKISKKARCQRWDINRGKPCVCGQHPLIPIVLV
jgi:hypothetical protein